MHSDIAISVKNVSKTFRIPHEKVSSLRGAAVSMLSRIKGYPARNASHSDAGGEEFKALDYVSFEVKKGEFFACLPARQGIIGRNGSEKSTFFNTLTSVLFFDIIEASKITRPDRFGMAGFVL